RHASMCELNAEARRAALAVGARCATDVTGFGLLGHALHIAAASRVTLIIESSRLPLLPGAREAWQRGTRTGGAERNESHLAHRVHWGDVSDVLHALLIDPQTSGGLLVAIPPPVDRIREYLSCVP